MADRISQYRQVRLTIQVPPQTPTYPDGIGDARADIFAIGVKRGVPSTTHLGTVQVKMPRGGGDYEDVVRALADAVRAFDLPF